MSLKFKKSELDAVPVLDVETREFDAQPVEFQAGGIKLDKAGQPDNSWAIIKLSSDRKKVFVNPAQLVKDINLKEKNGEYVLPDGLKLGCANRKYYVN